MRLLAKLLVAVIINAVGLLLAAHFIRGFILSGTFKELVIIALVLTVLNLILKPILKLILGPIIILTLGLGLIIVNAIVLFILDKLFVSLTIASVFDLLLASLLIGLINFIFHLATRT